MNNKAVFGLVKNEEHADRVITRLQDAGYPIEDISILLSDKRKGIQERDLGTGELKKPSTGKRGTLGTEKHTKAPEGGVTGATAGGIIGGSLGLLAGIGALAIPGLGAFIAAGPLMAALGGSAVGGALGLLTGALVGYGLPEFEVKKFEEGLKQGSVLISVDVENSEQIDEVKNILKEEGVRDIVASREKTGSKR